jgi:hypothetical protein
MKHNGIVTVLVAAAVLIAPSAGAQPSDKAMAEALFQQGRKLFDEGKTAEACTRFEESQRLEQKLGTLLNLAVCHEKQGRTASAWAEFTEAGSLAERRGEADRAAFARERANALSAKQSTLTIMLKADAPGLVVIVDGKDLGVHGAPLPVDPGRHRVEAKASGKKPWSMEVDVPAGPVSLTVEIPALEEEAPAASVDKMPVKQPAPATTATLEKPAGDGIHPATWACFGIGGAGLAVGAITGGLSLARTSELKDECTGGVCTGERRDDLSSANALANVSNVAFGVGIAGTAAGIIVLLATMPSGDSPSVAFAPAGDAGGGVSVPF